MQSDDLIEENKRLQAEVERLKDSLDDSCQMIIQNGRRANTLQSELTKARDGLLKILHASEWTRDDAHYREVAQTIAEKATANQSAPADKGQVDPVMRCSFCDATDTEGNPWSGGQETYNGDLIYRVWACKDHKHLGDAAVNAAKEQNEPVAWQQRSKEQDANWRWMDAKYVAEARSAGYEVRALYAEQPAPVAVVMPERIKHRAENPAGRITYIKGWNACLDEIARLNSEPKP